MQEHKQYFLLGYSETYKMPKDELTCTSIKQLPYEACLPAMTYEQFLYFITITRILLVKLFRSPATLDQ